MSTLQILLLVGFYVFYSLFIVSHHMNVCKAQFYYHIKKLTVKYNEKLYISFKNKEITQEEYELQKRSFRKEIKISRITNLIVSPVLSIPATISLILRYVHTK